MGVINNIGDGNTNKIQEGGLHEDMPITQSDFELVFKEIHHIVSMAALSIKDGNISEAKKYAAPYRRLVSYLWKRIQILGYKKKGEGRIDGKKAGIKALERVLGRLEHDSSDEEIIKKEIEKLKTK